MPPPLQHPSLVCLCLYFLEIVHTGGCWCVFGCNVDHLSYSKYKSCDDKRRWLRAQPVQLAGGDTPTAGNQGHCTPTGSPVCGVLWSRPV